MQPSSPSLELVPIESAPAPETPQKPPEAIDIQAPGALRLTSGAPPPEGDRFEREAARQYAEGHIDPPLWDRAFAQSNGDREAAARVYLKARATALRLLDRERRTEQRTLNSQRPPAEAANQSMPDPGDAPTRRAQIGEFVTRYRYVVLTAGVFAVMALAAWIVSAVRTPEPTAVAIAPKPSVAAMPAPAPASAPAPAAKVPLAAPVVKSGITPDFMTKLTQYHDAGNWNLLVLYAVEWTRLEPGNPAAWNELRAGYVNLRQFDDALVAAKKAVALAPADAALWRNVGYVNLDLDDPPAALSAFDEAAARDGHDVDSLRHAGLLHARLGRVPEAKAAFDRALVVLPGDAYAQCLKAAVGAAPIAANNQYSAAQQVRAIDFKCRGGDVTAQQTSAPPSAPAPLPAKSAPRAAAPRS